MLLLWLTLIPLCYGYNILISVPNCEKSESTLIFFITNGLLDAGHNVTLITAFKFSREHKNLKLVYVPELLPKAEKIMDEAGLDWSSDVYSLAAVYESVKVEEFWGNKLAMDVWKERKNYDLFFTLSHFSEPSYPYLLGNDIPFVQYVTSGFEIYPFIQDGHIISPAVLPSLISTYNEYMNFWERSRNFVSILEHHYGMKRAAREYMKAVIKKFPELEDYERFYDRVSLTLFNAHHALDGSVPLLPNQVEIGTIHCKKALPLKEVDKELSNFVEGSGQAGVIYFSLGSIAKSAGIPTETKQMFLEAFRRIPQRVLWKYEDADLKLPPNVFIRSWMPQQDILGHPKTKVFISHCGNLGSQEAKFHGVPILGLPMGFDQPRNCAKMTRKGQALVLNWDNLSVDKIVTALNTLVNDTSYLKRMRELSKIVQDQKDTAIDRAVWWIEYVIRHKGGTHLTYAGKALSIWQYLMLDVALFWLSASLFLIFGVVYVVRMICCRKRANKNGRAIGGSQRQNMKKRQ